MFIIIVNVTYGTYICTVDAVIENKNYFLIFLSNISKIKKFLSQLKTTSTRLCVYVCIWNKCKAHSVYIL